MQPLRIGTCGGDLRVDWRGGLAAAQAERPHLAGRQEAYEKDRGESKGRLQKRGVKSDVRDEQPWRPGLRPKPTREERDEEQDECSPPEHTIFDEEFRHERGGHRPSVGGVDHFGGTTRT